MRLGAEENSAPAPSGSTSVTVQRGRVELSNEHGRVEIRAGEEAAMQAGRAPIKESSATPEPAPVETPAEILAPLDVAWVPATRSLNVEGERVVFKAVSDGWEGQSVTGRFGARVSIQGAVRVDEKRDAHGKPFAQEGAGRSANFAPDGVWTYRFGGSELTVFPSGKTVLKMRDGKVVESVTPTASSALPDPGFNWRIGVKLDANAQGRLIVGSVYPRSPAEKAGFRVGDEVRTVNGRKDPTLDQVLYELKKSKQGELIRFGVRRRVINADLTVVSGDWE
ncbi:MAG: PDZ domain-containing protein [Planctomycetota bacterium]|nr:PDZ domain-containing protein [Planctomycetota bacterium]